MECRIAEGIHSYLMKNQQTGHSQVLHWNWPFLITPVMGSPLCSGVHTEWTRCTTTVQEEPILKVSENEEAPQRVNCLPLAQHQTGETPLGWVNRKLCAFLRMFSGSSLLDEGWKVQCRGKGMCRCKHQHSGGRGTDHIDEIWKIQLIMISSIPPLFFLENASLKHGWYETSMLPHALIFGMIIPSWIQMLRKLLTFPMLGTPTVVALPQWDKAFCSTN